MTRRGEHTQTLEAKGQSGAMTLFNYDYLIEGSEKNESIKNRIYGNSNFL